ncbi:CpaD family pilus assembly protein [Xanthobacter sp. DSM 14520]|uniref:CpaD family pilus assembly protein n=1 Tax=Xanthobacter autotrophicus (strain ATCC BAA-1158 / Py2) TaxID=78245 RepID=UPI00372776B3
MKRLRRYCGLGLAVAFGGLVAGCSADSYWTEPTYPLDYRQRHPIELADQRQVLEVFPRWAFGLDPRQTADVRGFAQSYRSTTKSILEVKVPTELPPIQNREVVNPIVRNTLETVRKTLVASGVEHRNIVVTYYRSNGGESPLRLSFTTQVARVPHECGKWPFDLAAGAGPEGWQNEPYWNLGCGYQKNLAAQTADPVDLLRPRQETPPDLARRVGDIGMLRDGKDPSTTYQKSKSIADGVTN